MRRTKEVEDPLHVDGDGDVNSIKDAFLSVVPFSGCIDYLLSKHRQTARHHESSPTDGGEQHLRTEGARREVLAGPSKRMSAAGAGQRGPYWNRVGLKGSIRALPW